MSTDQVVGFAEYMVNNDEFFAKVKSLYRTKTPNSDVIKLAESVGFKIDDDDIEILKSEDTLKAVVALESANEISSLVKEEDKSAISKKIASSTIEKRSEIVDRILNRKSRFDSISKRINDAPWP